jgi:hypothetical protein
LRLIYYVINLFRGLHIFFSMNLSIYLRAQNETVMNNLPKKIVMPLDGYGTTVLGHRGISALKEFFMGKRDQRDSA